MLWVVGVGTLLLCSIYSSIFELEWVKFRLLYSGIFTRAIEPWTRKFVNSSLVRLYHEYSLLDSLPFENFTLVLNIFAQFFALKFLKFNLLIFQKWILKANSFLILVKYVNLLLDGQASFEMAHFKSLVIILFVVLYNIDYFYFFFFVYKVHFCSSWKQVLVLEWTVLRNFLWKIFIT